ncbi:EcsC family protein [Mucilaginibacter pallidiroseus]|uniref:EcsC family protein n=1 Tax=Mucilaginibacter pallidiroseus TaxID=2599295 RepID=A0A563UJ61_9SPHI|nr:EcsC family protein [Mucilaginibacter pallidiroseus]TWR31343.1 EcsC family protein [Mucilaginibacter pallidiroseus]
MESYEQQVTAELALWKHKILQKPSVAGRLAQALQNKVNNYIPDKVHNAVTIAIEKMVKAMMFGVKYTTGFKMPAEASLILRESYVKKEINFYRKTASVEGAVTGAGGILIGLADFTALIAIKMKLLFNIASLYGFDVKDYKERLYLLYVFQLAYCSKQRQVQIFKILESWETYTATLPVDMNSFDWRTFQQEYRDYIDLAKMAQLLPVVGAAVGAIANYKLVARLGETAMNCFRMRIIGGQQSQ